MANLQEFAYPASFNFVEFNNIPTFAGKKRYCDEKLQKLSSGSGRIVYQVDNEKVLKLAKNQKGIAQNQEECRSYAIECGIGAEVYLYDDNGWWIEMQLARKATVTDFKRILNCTFEQVQAFVYDTHNAYARNGKKTGTWLTNKYREFLDTAYDNEWFSGLYDYMANTGLEAIGDLTRINSYGVVSDNGQENIVLIDMGLSDEVFDSYYKRSVRVTESDIKNMVKECVQQLLSEENNLISPEDAEAQGFAVSSKDQKYQEGEFFIPKNIGIGYKVFYLKNGKLYPPVIANDNAQETPIGVWLPASSPNIVGYTLKDHRPQVASGGAGTRGRSLGNLAFRPGWHLGEIPYAEQFLKKKTYNGKKVWPDNLVWAQVEYSNDIDYQDEAMSYGYSKNGNFRHSYAGLPKIPKNGSYRYRTNPNPATVPWIITGAMKVDKILSFDEVDQILRQKGIEPPIVMSEKDFKRLQ